MTKYLAMSENVQLTTHPRLKRVVDVFLVSLYQQSH